MDNEIDDFIKRISKHMHVDIYKNKQKIYNIYAFTIKNIMKIYTIINNIEILYTFSIICTLKDKKTLQYIIKDDNIIHHLNIYRVNKSTLKELLYISGGDLYISGGDVYQSILNIYRKKFCNGKARPLEEGEKHFLCSNYMGPGTRIDLYPDTDPYNKADACARDHDFEYARIMELSDDEERAHAIRESDENVIQCFKNANNGIYSKAGISGIKSKILFENTLGNNAKKFEGKYYGKK